jgi:hypothetical protein
LKYNCRKKKRTAQNIWRLRKFWWHNLTDAGETLRHVSRETRAAKIAGFYGDFGAGAPVVCQRLISAMVQIYICAVWCKTPSLRRELARGRQ